jgi:hypothetical protein
VHQRDQSTRAAQCIWLKRTLLSVGALATKAI